MIEQLSISKTELAVFCQRHGIRRIAVFGSALRTVISPDSDISLLVEFVPGRTPGLLGVAGLEIELSGLFGVRKVDLRTSEDLSHYIRQEVINTAEVLYTKAD